MERRDPECGRLIIRPTVREDMPELLRVYEAARRIMRESGNPNQWGDTHPPRELLEQDVSDGTGYAVTNNGRIVAAFALIPGDDPTYRVIEGAWLNDKPYAAIHRVGSDGTCSGILEAVVRFAKEQGIRELRIDTHEDNRLMQHVVRKNGFRYCGIIHLLNGDPRLAYQKTIV
ncbi:MAG: GNAT family N-acetyltransferase [Clostridia bacterium]|nr:GNAT family N-acetyltransferase [Clostridia bacterium]